MRAADPQLRDDALELGRVELSTFRFEHQQDGGSVDGGGQPPEPPQPPPRPRVDHGRRPPERWKVWLLRGVFMLIAIALGIAGARLERQMLNAQAES